MRVLLVAAAFVFAISMAPTSASAQRPIPINIESTPPGATVLLDAPTAPPLGVTPIRNARVTQGGHILIFRLEGYEETRLNVDVRRRRETFRAVLGALGTISIVPGNDATNGAAVRIDGQPIGNVPYRGPIQPGRHMVQVGREGFVSFSQWIELAGGQIVTLPVNLEREQPATGSILIAGDVSGAPIFIDGEQRGTTPQVIENLAAGAHQIEVRPPDAPAYRETVTIIAGQRAALNPNLRPQAPQGAPLRVITSVPGAQVSIDGEVIGASPISRDVGPGEHIVEATAAGFAAAQQTITTDGVNARVVSLTLESRPAAPGTITITSQVPNATVTVDNVDRGQPPVVLSDATPGRHAIVVRAPGYQDLRTTCDVETGSECTIDARLEPIGTPVRIATTTEIQGAELFFDGESRGPVPFEGNLPVGMHRLEVRAPGYTSHVEQVLLEQADSRRVFDVQLDLIPTGPSQEELAAQREERERQRGGAMSHAAGILPLQSVTLDLSVGWPYTAELRLSTSIFEFLGAGFTVRSFGYMTDFEGRVQVGVRPVPQIGVGGNVRFGGGIGPDANTAFASAEVLATIYFSTELSRTGQGSSLTDVGAFTLWLGGDVYSDEYPFTAAVCTDVNAEPMGARGCQPSRHRVEAAPMPPTRRGGSFSYGRQDQARLRLGGALELSLDRNWNFWGLLEGILAEPSEDSNADPARWTTRRSFANVLGIPTTDTEFYFRLGTTYKF